MRTIIDKINAFENSAETNVEIFNTIFLENPLRDCSPEDEVTIGEPCSPETVRIITVGTRSFRHDFKPSIAEISVTPDEFMGRTGEWKARKEAGLPFWKNAQGEYVETKPAYNHENYVMNEKEMSLKPIHYFLLQYIRGSENEYHTQAEMSKKLSITIRTIRDQLHEMARLGIITMTKEGMANLTRTKIVITEDWQ